MTISQSQLSLPKEAIALVGKVATLSDRHPGLQLDKLSPPAEGLKQMEAQKARLDEVVKCAGGPGASGLLQAVLKRRAQALEDINAKTFHATTTTPLTLHLSRANGL